MCQLQIHSWPTEMGLSSVLCSKESVCISFLVTPHLNRCKAVLNVLVEESTWCGTDCCLLLQMSDVGINWWYQHENNMKNAEQRLRCLTLFSNTFSKHNFCSLWVLLCRVETVLIIVSYSLNNRFFSSVSYNIYQQRRGNFSDLRF